MASSSSTPGGNPSEESSSQSAPHESRRGFEDESEESDFEFDGELSQVCTQDERLAMNSGMSLVS